MEKTIWETCDMATESDVIAAARALAQACLERSKMQDECDRMAKELDAAHHLLEQKGKEVGIAKTKLLEASAQLSWFVPAVESKRGREFI